MRSLRKWLVSPKWALPPVQANAVEQLELELYRGEPWGGVSPRGLTKGALGVILEPEAEKSTSAFKDPEQLEFWPVGRSKMDARALDNERAPFASTLLPLPWEE